eukprot:m.182333 g.182333  ORF g.182333 m.182333 type:complete len:64 (+) comp15524_c0_seq1:62-253(+)
MYHTAKHNKKKNTPTAYMYEYNNKAQQEDTPTETTTVTCAASVCTIVYLMTTQKSPLRKDSRR